MDNHKIMKYDKLFTGSVFKQDSNRYKLSRIRSAICILESMMHKQVRTKL